MFCTECGTKNEDEAKFCYKCGQALKSNKQEIKTTADNKEIKSNLELTSQQAESLQQNKLNSNEKKYNYFSLISLAIFIIGTIFVFFSFFFATIPMLCLGIACYVVTITLIIVSKVKTKKKKL